MESKKMIEFGNENMTFKHSPFLIKTQEGEDNKVSFIVSLTYEGKIGSDTGDTDIEQLKELLKKSVPLYPDKDEVYEIIFEDYILYQTRNESYCSMDDYEIRKGRYFIIFEKSRLLDMLPIITDCQCFADGSYYPNKWKHYGIYCQNHIIDIVSHNEPLIKKLSVNESQNIKPENKGVLQ